MSLVKMARKLRPIIEQAVQNLTEETALDAVDLFPAWKENQSYSAGQKIRYAGVLYSVLQDHVSQSDWTPTTASSLFAKVLIPDPNVVSDWEQPDSTNPYSKGDRVRFEGKIYESLIDGNVWSPSTYPAGWKEVT